MNSQLSGKLLVFSLLVLPCAADAPGTPPDQGASSPHIRFVKGPAGRAMKKGGIEVSFSNFTAEDGTLVERLVEDYKTPQAARAELEEECKHSKVKADGYRVDSDGKRIGRRVELVAPRSAREPERTMIVWTNGPLLFSLRSESREHVLDFEEQVYPPPESSQALRKQFQ